MKNNQYTPLPLSKLIAERLPELETEMIRDSRGVIAIRGGANWDMNLCSPTYSFTDCLRAIEMLDTTGWSDLYYRERQRELLEHYLADHYTIGKHTIAYLTELFTKEK